MTTQMCQNLQIVIYALTTPVCKEAEESLIHSLFNKKKIQKKEKISNFSSMTCQKKIFLAAHISIFFDIISQIYDNHQVNCGPA